MPSQTPEQSITVELSIPINDVTSATAASVLLMCKAIDDASEAMSSPGFSMPSNMGEDYLWTLAAKEKLTNLRAKALSAAKQAFVGVLMSEEAHEVYKSMKREK